MLHTGGDDVIAGREQSEKGDVERFRAVFVKIVRSKPYPPKYSESVFLQSRTTEAQARESLCPLRPGLAHSFAAEETAEITESGLRPPVAALSK